MKIDILKNHFEAEERERADLVAHLNACGFSGQISERQLRQILAHDIRHVDIPKGMPDEMRWNWLMGDLRDFWAFRRSVAQRAIRRAALAR